MVSKIAFVRGHGLSREEELQAHKCFRENFDKYMSNTEPIVPLLHTCNIPPRVANRNVSRRTIQQQFLGKDKTCVRLSEVSLSSWDSLIDQKSVQYSAKIGPILISDVEKTKEQIKQYTEPIKQVAKNSMAVLGGALLFSAATNMFSLTQSFFDGYYPYIPDLIVAALPFYSAQRIERGSSDRILKYRAIGDVFLAHQKGSTDTFRVDLTLIGPYRLYYLQYLLSLQQRGENTLKGLNDITTGVTPISEVLPTDLVKIPKEGKVQYEAHATFPIITQTSILLDMFLQTLEWHQTKDKGGNSIVYATLLFRKYIEPQGYTVFKKDDKLGYLNYGTTQSERMRKELLIDTMWKLARISKENTKIGMFGGSNMLSLDREAVSSDPYITNTKALLGGFSYDINNAAEIFGMV